MAKTVTVGDLINRIRRQADMENSEFVTDAELRELITVSAAELLDLLVSADVWLNAGDDASISITADTATYSLPSDFYRLQAVDVRETSTSNYANARRVSQRDRNMYQGTTGWVIENGTNLGDGFQTPTSNVGYRTFISGSTHRITFYPTPTSSTNECRINYVPEQLTLDDNADVVNGVNGWEEYIVLDVAIKILVKEESETAALERKLRALTDRISEMAVDRDQTEPGYISETRGRGGPGRGFHGRHRWRGYR